MFPDKATPFSVAISYEVVTPESAEIGDADERGWTNEGEELTLGDTLATLRRYAPYDDIQDNGTRASFYEADGTHDYRTGADRRQCVHVTASPRALSRLVRYARARRYA